MSRRVGLCPGPGMEWIFLKRDDSIKSVVDIHFSGTGLSGVEWPLGIEHKGCAFLCLKEGQHIDDDTFIVRRTRRYNTIARLA